MIRHTNMLCVPASHHSDLEPGVFLDFMGTIVAQSLVGILLHQPLHQALAL